MGNDGGSIPTRRELVKNAARNPNTSEVKATQLESQTHAWTFCPLSQGPLASPIVSDCAGILYNKDAIIEYLLPSDESIPDRTKTEHEEAFAERIKSLRDVVEVKFQIEKSDAYKGEKRVCPVTSKELGPNTKAVYLVPCGHAFSEVAIKEVASETCLQCSEVYEKENIIPILPVAKEDTARLAVRIQRLKAAGLTHSLKKSPGGKKKKKNEVVEDSNAAAQTKTMDDIKTATVNKLNKRLLDSSEVKNGEGTSVPQSRSGTATPSGINNAATASLTAKVLDEQEERNKRRKLGLNDNLKSLFSNNTGSDRSTQKGGDFMTRGYSIPKRV